ncbi:thioesterase II family protein [Catellatospora methionotrophica]|uniref:thioesterase II family protein n=1 Tax=Catellatospora methionotrophica TaxID=121620 RepID=UPI0033C68251
MAVQPVWWSPLRPPAAAPARRRLLVLPHSGAGPNSYRPLLGGLPGDVEVRGLTLPGRERRLGERTGASLDDVLSSLGELGDPLPTVVFGHSLGALLAMWVACELGGDCAGVIVSGQAPGASRRWRHRPPTEAEMIELLEAGDVPLPKALYTPRWRAVLLDALRADLRLGAEAADFDRIRLDAPLTVLAGQADRLVDPTALGCWARHTSASCRTRLLPGGHFAVLAACNRAEVTALIAATVAKTVPVLAPGLALADARPVPVGSASQGAAVR